MKNKKNNLDERQEQKLLQIEHNAMWIAFISLIAAIVFQMIFGGENCFPYTSGEMVVLIVMSLYLVVACYKNNIWDRSLKPNFKTNLVISLIAGVITGVICGFMGYNASNSGSNVTFGIVLGTIAFLITVGLCLAILSILGKGYKKRVKAEEEKADEE